MLQPVGPDPNNEQPSNPGGTGQSGKTELEIKAEFEEGKGRARVVLQLRVQASHDGALLWFEHYADLEALRREAESLLLPD